VKLRNSVPSDWLKPKKKSDKFSQHETSLNQDSPSDRLLSLVNSLDSMDAFFNVATDGTGNSSGSVTTGGPTGTGIETAITSSSSAPPFSESTEAPPENKIDFNEPKIKNSRMFSHILSLIPSVLTSTFQGIVSTLCYNLNPLFFSFKKPPVFPQTFHHPFSFF